MDFLPKKIDQYVIDHSQNEPELLQQLFIETWQKALVPRMISGHFQGRVLSMISKLIQPVTILEIGTYTGYSALCLAEGLQKSGTLHTIDHNEELVYIQQKYFKKSLYYKQIKSYTGNALEHIQNINVKFDLAFIDADKENYSKYFFAIIEKMNKGGVILSDNVLWSGKVTEEPDSKDKDTIALIAYNKLLNSDERVESILLPIRDGLTISMVK